MGEFTVIHISEMTKRERKNYDRHLAEIDRRIEQYQPGSWVEDAVNDALREATIGELFRSATLKDWICVILFAAGIFAFVWAWAIAGMMIEAIIN